MGRPSKKDVALREKIIGLGLFVRDSFIYEEIEETLNCVNKNILGDIFIRRCATKSIKCESLLDDERLKKHMSISSNCSNINLDDLIISKNKLQKFDGLYEHYQHLLEQFVFNDIEKENPHNYNVEIRIYKEDLIGILNEERINDIFGGMESADLKRYIDFSKVMRETFGNEEYSRTLTDEEYEKLSQFYFTRTSEDIRVPKTTIKRDDMYIGSTEVQKHNLQFFPNEKFSIDYGVRKNKLVNIELDFTKPKEDIMAYVEKIKDDFDENLEKGIDILPNIYDLLGDDGKIFKYDVKNCDIYKTNNIKPIGGRLADALFIYDCKKVNELLDADILINKYILDEINKYWTETRNLFKDKMQPETLSEYYKLAVDYIDNKKYKCYLSGYDLDTKK